MSVLKTRRKESKAQFCATANEIYNETLNFLSRLSSRYSRLLAENTMKLASEILDCTEKANSIIAVDEIRLNLRKNWLIQARASLAALDTELTHIYEILMMNPQGAFTTTSGKSIESGDAKRRLDNMAQHIGELIDLEEKLLTGVLKSDTDIYRKKQKDKAEKAV